MDGEIISNVLNGQEDDVHGLIWKVDAMVWSGRIGMLLLWIAAILTFVTGLDYFAKARPFLRD
jgi:CDP-diacylglycerol--glycerol-3-phosphate 3-phosphatidyltransferase